MRRDDGLFYVYIYIIYPIHIVMAIYIVGVDRKWARRERLVYCVIRVCGGGGFEDHINVRIPFVGIMCVISRYI